MLCRVATYKDLCKVQIACFSSFSALTGYVLSIPRFGLDALLLITGVFLLACGSGALNQYQEKDIDALMVRTRHRPLPSKRLLPKNAMGIALFLLASGFSLILLLGLPIVVALGCFAVIWYNGVYTYLKRLTAFAVIPGAFIGTIPPCMGWLTGGGALSDPSLWGICFFFYVWQVPHFWLFLLTHGSDYERAGLPSLTRSFSKNQIERITFVWTLAVAVSGMLMPLYKTGSSVFYVLLVAASVWLGWHVVKLTRSHMVDVSYYRLFRKVNVYICLVMMCLTAEGLIGMLRSV